MADQKRASFKAAQSLLEQEGSDTLVYAALQLRRCLEAVVYEKLQLYRDRLPVTAAKIWQPNKAFRILCQVEPDAAITSPLAVRLMSPSSAEAALPPTWIGTDYRPDPAWLDKTYHTLGSHIHVPKPSARKGASDAEIREKLMNILTELRRYVEHTFTFVPPTPMLEFECPACKLAIIASASAVEKLGHVECLQCDLKWPIVREGEDFMLYPEEVALLCSECEGRIDLAVHEIETGHQFSCERCGQHFEVEGQVWSFRKTVSHT